MNSAKKELLSKGIGLFGRALILRFEFNQKIGNQAHQAFPKTEKALAGNTQMSQEGVEELLQGYIGLQYEYDGVNEKFLEQMQREGTSPQVQLKNLELLDLGEIKVKKEILEKFEKKR